jgi:hypothetical protein
MTGEAEIRGIATEHDRVMLAILAALVELNYPQVELEELGQGVDGWWLPHLRIHGTRRTALEPVAFPVAPGTTIRGLSAQISITLRQILPVLVAEAEEG